MGYMTQLTTRNPRTIIKRLPRAIFKQSRRLIVTLCYRKYFQRNQNHTALNLDRATEAVRNANTILFCCWGNICRSPMAEKSLRNTLDTPRGNRVTVQSAGLGEYSGRSSPPEAQNVASSYGVDLSSHRSVRATPAMIKESDVVFVMDFHTYYLLTLLHPEPDHVYFLSVFSDGDVEIPDPAGKSSQKYNDVFERISSATEKVASVLQETDK